LKTKGRNKKNTKKNTKKIQKINKYKNGVYKHHHILTRKSKLGSVGLGGLGGSVTRFEKLI